MATKKKDNDEKDDEVVVQVSQVPDLRAMREAEYRQPTPLEIAAQYEAAPDKDAFVPEYVSAGAPAALMPEYAEAEATTTGGAGAVSDVPAAGTTTTTVDAPEATPGTTTTLPKSAGGATGSNK